MKEEKRGFTKIGVWLVNEIEWRRGEHQCQKLTYSYCWYWAYQLVTFNVNTMLLLLCLSMHLIICKENPQEECKIMLFRDLQMVVHCWPSSKRPCLLQCMSESSGVSVNREGSNKSRHSSKMEFLKGWLQHLLQMWFLLWVQGWRHGCDLRSCTGRTSLLEGLCGGLNALLLLSLNS